MNEYNIDDLLIDTCVEHVWELQEVDAYNNFSTNNKKTIMKNELNFIQKRKLDAFVSSTKADELAKLIEEAEKIVTLYNVIWLKVWTIADVIDTHIECVNNAVEDENVTIIEDFMEEIQAILDEVNSKELSANIAWLTKVFGIEVNGKTKIDKTIIRKALWLK